jgi:hypothetical protein
MRTRSGKDAAFSAALERFERDDAALAEALAEARKILKKRGRAALYKTLERRPDLAAAIFFDVVRGWRDEAVNRGEVRLPN